MRQQLLGRIYIYICTVRKNQYIYIYMYIYIYIHMYTRREEESMRQQLLGRVLSKEAYTRLGNVQSVDPKRVRVIEDKIIAMARSG